VGTNLLWRCISLHSYSENGEHILIMFPSISQWPFTRAEEQDLVVDVFPRQRLPALIVMVA
jgi:hypothetical protein